MPSRVAPTISAKPSKKRRRWILAVALFAVLFWPAQYVFWQYHLKRYQAVDEGVLYRSAQPTQLGLRYLAGRKGVKTVLSLQMYQWRLHRGLYDPFDASGEEESQFVTGLGVKFVQWPMGDEWCWPWLTPWQFEEYFKLLDNPDNLPLAVHCMGGRHRTGTLSALYRLEYDRWPIDRVLEEMYSFKFGHKIPLQEYNLRTYLPRPQPDAQQWQELAQSWGASLGGSPPANYEDLVRRLRSAMQDPDRRKVLHERLASTLGANKPFALCLAARVIDQSDDPLASTAASAAARCLQKLDGSPTGWSVAAALIADFGDPQQQQQLLNLLTEGATKTDATPRDEAIIAGVTNRYTPNRLPYLRPLLKDQRHYLAAGASMLRYCDTAVLRVAAILDQGLMPKYPEYTATDWDAGRELADKWFDEHPQDAIVSQLRPASGQNVVRVGAAPPREDFSRD